MNYIEQINLLHTVRIRDHIDPYAITLYVILLDRCNRDNWHNPVSMKNATLMSEMGVSYVTLCNARNRLQQSGLLKFDGRNGIPIVTYTLLTTEQMIEARTLIYNIKVTDEVGEKVGAKVTDEVSEKVTAKVGDEVCATNTKGIKNKTETKQNQTLEILTAGNAPRSTSKKIDKEIIQTPDAEQPIQNNKVVAPAAEPDETTTTLHTTCLNHYTGWFKQRFGITPNVDATNARALNMLIKYFRAQLPADTPTDESREAIESAFKLVLDGWDRLDEFTQKQTKLVQLASNIQNIIVQLKTQSTHANTKKQQAGPGYVPIWRR